MLSLVVSFAMCMTPMWEMSMIDRTTAYTTLRLWNQIYKHNRQTHDFYAMLSPSSPREYIAVSRLHEIQSIASCKREDKLYVESIAHAPEKEKACAALISMINEQDISIDLKNQPRWHFESMYIQKS